MSFHNVAYLGDKGELGFSLTLLFLCLSPFPFPPFPGIEDPFDSLLSVSRKQAESTKGMLIGVIWPLDGHEERRVFPGSSYLFLKFWAWLW